MKRPQWLITIIVITNVQMTMAISGETAVGVTHNISLIAKNKLYYLGKCCLL